MLQHNSFGRKFIEKLFAIGYDKIRYYIVQKEMWRDQLLNNISVALEVWKQ